VTRASRFNLLIILLVTVALVCQAHVSGRMTGGGSIFQGSLRITHGFEIHCGPNEEPPGTGFAEPNTLEINWAGNHFHMDDLIFGVCTTDPGQSPNPPAAGFTTFDGAGFGSYNNVPGARVSFRFTDYGEPGTNDLIVRLTIVAEDGTVVLDVTAPTPLTFGNHQAHAS
jgi:hypothetical protein